MLRFTNLKTACFNTSLSDSDLYTIVEATDTKNVTHIIGCFFWIMEVVQGSSIDCDNLTGKKWKCLTRLIASHNLLIDTTLHICCIKPVNLFLRAVGIVTREQPFPTGQSENYGFKQNTVCRINCFIQKILTYFENTDDTRLNRTVEWCSITI